MERLADVVRKRLEASPLDAEARAVVLAAGEGEAELAQALGAGQLLTRAAERDD